MGRSFTVVLLAATLLQAQQSGLQFEVVSVRPAVFPSDLFAAGFRAARASNPCSSGAPSVSGTRVSLKALGICDIIRIAYDVKSYQVIGIPPALGFSGQDKSAPVSMQASMADAGKQPNFFYDVEARSPGSDAPNPDQVREMLRALLADRFHLTLHRATRELAYYAMVAAKNGPKLTPAVEGCKPHGGTDVMSACGRNMEQVARLLTQCTDRMVLDETGVAEKFDYEIPIEPTERADRSVMMANILGHLKLKLEPRKGPIEVVVVDHVERPSEN